MSSIKYTDFRLDAHTHMIASGHAYGTIREMAAAAADRGLDLLGLSEHGPGTPGTCHPIYFQNLRGTVPRRLSNVEILHGCEVNVQNDWTLSQVKGFLNDLDYALAGIHPQCYTDAGAEKNTENLILYMKHPKIFFVSHPDSDKLPVRYDRLVSAAKKYHAALEVNNSSLRYPGRRPGCVENYKTMLALCRKQEVPVLVSSDAHDPSEVGLFYDALKLLNEVQFPPELILNTDVDRFKQFIGFPRGGGVLVEGQ